MLCDQREVYGPRQQLHGIVALLTPLNLYSKYSIFNYYPTGIFLLDRFLLDVFSESQAEVMMWMIRCKNNQERDVGPDPTSCHSEYNSFLFAFTVCQPEFRNKL